MFKKIAFFQKKHKLLFFILLSAIFILLIFVALIIFLQYEGKLHQNRIQYFYEPPKISNETKPGEILRIEPLDISLVSGKAYRIIYTSELNQKVVPVSGVVYVSTRPAPDQGRNIVAWAHGTVGLGESCAPSRRANPTLILEPWLSQMMDKGWIVIATDYYGLGMPGQHQYLIGESEAMDVLNSIRAVKSFERFRPGENIAIFGHSQGGHSALFSANIASEYAPELGIKGIVAAAPAAELNALLGEQFDKPLTRIIAPEIYLSWVEKYNLPTDIINPKYTLEQNIKIANKCIERATAAAVILMNLRETYFSSNPSLNPEWSEVMTLQTPSPEIKIPLMISQGLDDTVVLPSTTNLFIKKSCNSGSKLTVVYKENTSHAELPNVTSKETVSWISDRFEDRPQKNDCIKN